MDILKDKSFTIEEVTELLGKSRNTISNWYTKGVRGRVLKVFRIGKEIRITEQALNEFAVLDKSQHYAATRIAVKNDSDRSKNRIAKHHAAPPARRRK